MNINYSNFKPKELPFSCLSKKGFKKISPATLTVIVQEKNGERFLFMKNIVSKMSGKKRQKSYP